MSEITIEIVQDADHSDGGQAVIRLNGLWLLPANATFRIEPVDSQDSGELPADWPKGDRSPLSTRLTPQGVEIVVGPDIVDAPPLLPGTPVVISVPAAFVRAEALWPDLPVSTPRAALPVVLTAAELAAELEAVAEASRKREEEDALLAIQRQIADASAAMPAPEVSAAGDEKELARLKRPNGYDFDVAALSPAPAASAASASTTVSDSDDRPRAFATAKPSGTVATTGTALAPDRPRELVPVGGPPRVAARTSSQRPRMLSIGLPFALGFAIAAALTAVVSLRQGGWSGPPAAADTAAASFSDLLTVAAVSPRGRSAADVDLPTALKLADESLHLRTGGPDQVEASFWLRKSIALSVGTPQLTWTLTQLGTLYAQPVSGAADYGKARLLWELAGASGDAMALCFLGALYEHGLGVKRSNREALGYYQRAKARGGCTDVDSAIARVRN